MKRFLTALVFFAFCISACQKEITGEITGSTTTPGTPTTSGSMTAKINGQAWVADKGAAATFSTTGFGLPSLINITGVGADKKSITITLIDSGKRSYTLPGDVSSQTLLYNFAAHVDSNLANKNAFATNQAWLTSQTGGTVTITDKDTVKKTISGTFSFNVYRQLDSLTRAITEGVFTNIPYTTGSGLPPAATTDTFRVKINGTAFTPGSITGSALPGVNTIAIQSMNQALDKNVGLTFPSNITPGTYQLSLFGGTHIGLYNEGSNSYGSSTGSMTILEHNTTTKRIRGNFNFSGSMLTNPIAIKLLTEGYFSVVYQ